VGTSPGTATPGGEVDGGNNTSNDGSSGEAAAPTTPVGAGKAIFDKVCFACHGTDGGGRFVRLSIRGAPAQRITNKIANIPAMSFLSSLSATDISNVAAYLAALPGTSTQLLVGAGDPARGEAAFRRDCTGCHAMGGSTRVGPDLLNVVDRRPAEWIQAMTVEPKALLAHGGYGAGLDTFPFWMSDTNASDSEALDIWAFLQLKKPLVPSAPVALTSAQFEETKNLYFNRCAGCHGVYRTGATGPKIDEARSKEIGTDGLAAMMRHGTPGGMPNFGTAKIMTEDQITKMAAYLQLPPPEAPPLPMEEIQASWKLIVPVANRPSAPQTTRDWQNYFGVVLRDAGQIAVFDGDSHEEVARLDVGFAVHILRSSSSGRYFYAIGRDGLVTLIDLWPAKPNVVATVKGCHDARSVDASKFKGYEDKYLIEGCYWPPQYVVYDGLTLQPLARNDIPLTSITGESLPEVRVAAILASPFAPVWVVNQKESGYVGIVDYSKADFPLTSNIKTERFLHDGGWDNSKRYFMTAANASNKMVIVDVQTRSLVTSFTTGDVPHPGRGANWRDPVYGWVNATGHIGSPLVAVYGADPVGNPANAWKVVRNITLPSAGSLFIKTHPNSPWVLVDMTLSATNDKQICAIAKATGKIDKCFDVATAGKAVHMEFNKAGTEVWISDWATAGGGEIVLDAKTLNVIKRIPLPAVTGKFNVYNTVHDIY
jgi:nitrite reductase (NO-forming)/hydroxylamine reductase